MATMNISLPDQMREWVQGQIESGKYASSSDYVRDLIREHQTYNEKLEALRSHLSVGEEQAKNGEFVEGFSMDSLITELDQE